MFIRRIGLLLALALASSSPLRAGPADPVASPVAAQDGVTSGVSPDGRSGFGALERSKVPCLTEEQRLRIQAQLQANLVLLGQLGLLAPKVPWHVLLEWPIQAVGSAADGFGVHGISNFVDQDPAFPNQLLDYNCGQRTYDLANGYNHGGIDIFTWPLPWNWMELDEVHVVAAAPGTIVLKSGGNFDKNCGFNGGNWNAVYVRHADGVVVWYGHMKKGSLTTKLVGDTVSTGEYLGVVGSSGNSTGPHLHLELHDAAGQLVEPFAGPCNAMNQVTYWRDQRPYIDSAVNRLMIGNAAVSYPACPNKTVTHEAAAIQRGTVGYFTTFYRDQLDTQVSQYRILRPDGTTFLSWNGVSNAPYYPASWWWWSWSIPASAPVGTWTFQVTFDGVTYEKTFGVI